MSQGSWPTSSPRPCTGSGRGSCTRPGSGCSGGWHGAWRSGLCRRSGLWLAQSRPRPAAPGPLHFVLSRGRATQYFFSGCLACQIWQSCGWGWARWQRTAAAQWVSRGSWHTYRCNLTVMASWQAYQAIAASWHQHLGFILRKEVQHSISLYLAWHFQPSPLCSGSMGFSAEPRQPRHNFPCSVGQTYQ